MASGVLEAGKTEMNTCDNGEKVRVTTPVSSPQSNGMAEASVRTLKRDIPRGPVSY